jgi:alanine dehydrogenase
MPGAVGRTSTYGLTNATLPFAIQIANKGVVRAVRENKAIAKGVNIYKGKITYKAVADAFKYEAVALEGLLG